MEIALFITLTINWALLLLLLIILLKIKLAGKKQLKKMEEKFSDPKYQEFLKSMARQINDFDKHE